MTLLPLDPCRAPRRGLSSSNSKLLLGRKRLARRERPTAASFKVTHAAVKEHDERRRARRPNPVVASRRDLVTLLIVLTSLSVGRDHGGVVGALDVFDTDHYVATVGLDPGRPGRRCAEPEVDGCGDGWAPDQEGPVDAPTVQIGSPCLPSSWPHRSPTVFAPSSSNGSAVPPAPGRSGAVDPRQPVRARSGRIAPRGRVTTRRSRATWCISTSSLLVNDLLAEVEGVLSDVFDRTIDIPEPRVNVPRVIPALEQRFGIDLPDDFGKIRYSSRIGSPPRNEAVEIADRLVIVAVSHDADDGDCRPLGAARSDRDVVGGRFGDRPDRPAGSRSACRKTSCRSRATRTAVPCARSLGRSSAISARSLSGSWYSASSWP